MPTLPEPAGAALVAYAPKLSPPSTDKLLPGAPVPMPMFIGTLVLNGMYEAWAGRMKRVKIITAKTATMADFLDRTPLAPLCTKEGDSPRRFKRQVMLILVFVPISFYLLQSIP